MIKWTPKLSLDWLKLIKTIVNDLRNSLKYNDLTSSVGLFADAKEESWSL